jgi:hypothetical protein
MKVASAIAAACFIASAGAFAPMPVPAPGAGLLRHRHAATRLFADLKTAEAAAVSATKQFGIKSPQAVSAWEEFEEIASADNSAASKPGLDEACAVRARHFSFPPSPPPFRPELICLLPTPLRAASPR